MQMGHVRPYLKMPALFVLSVLLFPSFELHLSFFP
jgi:hypothetical protein